MVEPQPLHMIRMRLDGRRLFELARRRGLLADRGEEDVGYLVHSLLGEVFGELAPKPFALPDQLPGCSGLATPDRAGGITVLGYSANPAAALREHAAAFADPFAHAAVEWTWFDGKPMPASFLAGCRLGFTVRVCPVERSMRLRGDRTKSPEVDALIVEGERQGIAEGLDRGAVYGGWLARQFERQGGAHLVSSDMVAFRFVRLQRRDQKTRTPGRLPRMPDAVLKGVIDVTEPDAFLALLARGVGRHRAFGFGMLLLQPVQR